MNINWIDLLPFCAMATNTKKPELNMQRIGESLLVAGVTAAVTMYGTVAAMGSRLDRIEVGVNTMTRKITEIEIARASITAQRAAELQALSAKDIDHDDRIKRLEIRAGFR